MITYLYVKTHTITGLKYLGQTKKDDPHKYRGSGIRWLNHLKVHGYTYTTEILKECEHPAMIKFWGQHYSDLWNIVDSDEWANLKPETGDGSAGTKWNDNQRAAHKAKVIWNKGKGKPKPLPKGRNFGTDNPATRPAVKEKISNALKGRVRSQEHCDRLSQSLLGKKKKPQTPEHQAKLQASRAATRDRKEKARLSQAGLSGAA